MAEDEVQVAVTTEKEAEAESAKRRQILEGAREVFLSQGFDAASMGEIARAAGVSKGTLYVYFDSKEQLFEAIIGGQCGKQAEQVFTLSWDEHDVGTVLRRLGEEFLRFLCTEEKVSSVRSVISIAERMPELGERFYEMGPASGIARVAAYLQAQVEAGLLDIEDCELAAAQFLESCTATVFKPVLFASAPPPAPERIAYVVDRAVRTFLAAYAVANKS